MRIEPEKRVIKYDKEPDVLKISKATTIESGALTLTSGALAMTSGNLTLTSGNAAITGSLTVTGDTGINITPASADTGVESVLKVKQILFDCVGGGITETLTAAIPAHAFVLGVQGKIKVLVTGTTIATFLLGVTGDTNRFGNFAALTKNTAVTPADVQAEAAAGGRYYAAATDILLTGNAGTFDAVGTVAVVITYIDMSPPTNYA